MTKKTNIISAGEHFGNIHDETKVIAGINSDTGLLAFSAYTKNRDLNKKNTFSRYYTEGLHLWLADNLKKQGIGFSSRDLGDEYGFYIKPTGALARSFASFGSNVGLKIKHLSNEQFVDIVMASAAQFSYKADLGLQSDASADRFAFVSTLSDDQRQDLTQFVIEEMAQTGIVTATSLKGTILSFSVSGGEIPEGKNQRNQYFSTLTRGYVALWAHKNRIIYDGLVSERSSLTLSQPAAQPD